MNMIFLLLYSTFVRCNDATNFDVFYKTLWQSKFFVTFLVKREKFCVEVADEFVCKQTVGLVTDASSF